jgi:hypothetical protein
MELSAISSHRDTKAMDNPHRRMILNDVLNAFYGGCLDEDCFLGEEEDYIDDDGAVDDDKRDAYMACQEAEEERKQNLLLTLIQTVKLEAQEQR